MFWDKLFYSVIGDNECLGYSDLNFYFKLFLRFLKKINQWHYFLYYFNWLWVCTCICVLHEWWLVIFIGILSVNTVSNFFLPINSHLSNTSITSILDLSYSSFFFFPFMCSLSRCLSRLKYILLTYLNSALQYCC